MVCNQTILFHKNQTILVTLDLICMDKKKTGISQNILNCVSKKKERNTGLEQHKSELMTTILFLGERSLKHRCLNSVLEGHCLARV